MYLYLNLILPLTALILAKIIKIILKIRQQKKITYLDFFAYSDMPSEHATVVISLATIIALSSGIDSAIFAISFIFAGIIIADAIGLRNYLGAHGKALNVLVKDLKEDELLDNAHPKQLEKIGHTPFQVIIGAIIGFLVSLIGWLIFT